MKKVTFLTCVLALCTSTMFAQTLEVTTADMDPVAAGGLVYVIDHAESGSVIEFNFDGEVLDYGEGTGIAIKGKKLTFNGINKKNGKRVTIKGLESLFTVGEASEISLNDLIIDGFKNIAIRLSGNSTLNANNCQFSNNYEPLSSKVNNGGVIRVSGSNAFLKNSLFLKNRCGASYGGGAVCAYGDSELRVENCSFVENEGAAGGAIGVNATAKNPSPRVYIANSTFANNIADDRGGAIYMQTATAVDVFSPVIVNCTFVGNLGSNGGALCVWSKATTTMEPTFVNNLFAENYSNTWMDDESRFDIVAFYMAGQVDANNQPLPQTVLPVCKNNLYVAASDGFFADGSNKAVNFDSDVIFAATEQNPWDEGDESYNHQTSVLSGDMKIAMIAENSIASGAGIAVVDGVEIPTVDQLGNARPATPSVGAVEYSSLCGITVDPLVALPAGGLCGLICMRQWKNALPSIEFGLQKMSVIAVLLIGTGTIAGVIKDSTLKDYILAMLDHVSMGKDMIAPISGILMSAATASTTAGATLASASFADTILAVGVSSIWGAAMVNAGSTVLDHLPHGSFFHATGGVCDLTFRDRLKLIPYETLIGAVLTLFSIIMYWICR